MSRLSLRWRLTLYYAAMLSLILLLGGLVFLWGLRSSLNRSLDTALQDAATLAASQLGGDEGGVELGQALVQNLGGTTTLLVRDANGQITDRVGTLNVDAPLRDGLSTIGNLRVFTLRLANGEWVQAARSEAETAAVLGQVQRLLLLGVPLLLLAGLGAGFLIADRALRPVDRVTGLAARIADGGRYQERVPPVPGDDELARLTRTVNAMLGTLEATIQRERAFALAAAHELRSPLTVLRGRASLTLEHELSPAEYRQAVQQMHEVSTELSEMVESLLTLARTNAPPLRQPCDWADVAREVVRGQQASAEAREIRLDLSLQPASLRADPTGLRMIAANLISNAVQYGRSGGSVCVWTGLDREQAVLEVSDDGPGVAPEELERLLQPFQRGRDTQGQRGSGVGLALVKAIAEQHGGQIELGRAKAGGLRARVSLPG